MCIWYWVNRYSGQHSIDTVWGYSSVHQHNMSCLIGWFNDMWAVTIRQVVILSAGQHSRRYFSKPLDFCAASCWPGVVPSFNRYVAGGLCSGVLCNWSIPCCLQLYISTALVLCRQDSSLCRQNSSSRIMLCAPRTLQEFISKTFRGSVHAKNKWIQHIEQNELCYTEKSPTVEYQ